MCDSSSEEEATKTVIESKDHIEDDALNASIRHTASNDSSSSSSEGDLLPIFQSTMRRSAVPDDLPAKINEESTQPTTFSPVANASSLKNGMQLDYGGIRTSSRPMSQGITDSHLRSRKSLVKTRICHRR